MEWSQDLLMRSRLGQIYERNQNKVKQGYGCVEHPLCRPKPWLFRQDNWPWPCQPAGSSRLQRLVPNPRLRLPRDDWRGHLGKTQVLPRVLWHVQLRCCPGLCTLLLENGHFGKANNDWSASITLSNCYSPYKTTSYSVRLSRTTIDKMGGCWCVQYKMLTGDNLMIKKGESQRSPNLKTLRSRTKMTYISRKFNTPVFRALSLPAREVIKSRSHWHNYIMRHI